jgi:hypothetical protein
MTTALSTCPACGAAASGNFCSSCGASLTPRSCGSCHAELSAQARFCHRCGHPVASGTGGGRRSERTAWLVAAVLCVLLVGGIVYKVSGGTPAPAPDMANTGADSRDRTPAQRLPGEGLQGRAPDISGMTPRERFDRLFNRVMQAAERDFLANYRAEMAANRVEYLEHKPALDEFRKEAERAAGRP